MKEKKVVVTQGLSLLETKDFLVNCLIPSMKPAFLRGTIGIGKSSIIKQIAEENGWFYIEERASRLTPSEVAGLPFIPESQKDSEIPESRYTLIWFLKKAQDAVESGKYKKAIVFLDEINLAPQSVLFSLYSVVLDRRLGEYKLNENIYIVAAGNKSNDKSFVFELPSALKARFAVIDIDPNLDDYLKHFMAKDITPSVIAFLKQNPQYLTTEVNDRFANPRSWESLSDVLKSAKRTPRSVEISIIIGEVAGGAFNAYMDFISKIDPKEIDRILEEGKSEIDVTKKLDVLYYIVTTSGQKLSNIKDKKLHIERLTNYMKWINKTFDQEILHGLVSFAIATYIESAKAKNNVQLASIISTPVWVEFRQKYAVDVNAVLSF